MTQPRLHLTESPGFSGIPNEFQTFSRGLLAPGAKSVRNSFGTVSGVSKQSLSRLRRLFRDFLGRTLCGPRGQKAPGDSLETLSGFPSPEGPGDSCKGRAGLQDGCCFFGGHGSKGYLEVGKGLGEQGRGKCPPIDDGRPIHLVRQPLGLFSAKNSAEKTKCIDVSQPPHQGDELKGR